MKSAGPAVVLAIALAALACGRGATTARHTSANTSAAQRATTAVSPAVKRLIDAAVEQTSYTKSYDPSYTRIGYPGGDVPLDRGVCSDVIVRAFRKVGVDLQKEVHEDMARNFSDYPQRWGLAGPDPNIDHRRVPNLMTYFKRQGKALGVSAGKEDYLPGDVVAWDLGGGLLHIGLVTDVPAGGSGGYKVVHNIGAGAQVEDVLLNWKVIGHYRYFDRQ